ncbi:hypothetical protein FEM48_ZijujUnG0063400 [Ziziphus jujuba var. spinosa]|uniref:Uncharacterized protein n=1 Tax=Ziziphus jujuba var. spinosa TaxID=714518 RepID=A0A978U8Y2_ZIZJJ|nr:hypothetical protein FEM48_ZijujUnG0063400 [Ziziphus jujuba var. spinosa]
MEEISKTIGQLSAWHKTTHPPPSESSFEAIAGNSFQVWRKPYSKSLPETGSNTTRTAMAKNSFVQPSDANPNSPVLAIIDDNNTKNQDDVVDASEPVAVDGNKSQLKRPRNVDQNVDPRKLKRYAEIENEEASICHGYGKEIEGLRAQIEENKVEVSRLRQLHLKLQQHQLQAHSRMLNWESGGLEQILNTGLNEPGFGQNIGLLNSNQGNTKFTSH